MKHLFCILAALFALPAVGFTQTLLNVDSKGIAIKGYDPVAFFTDNKPVKGDPAIQSTYAGATYRFASTDHKKMFDANPSKYEPQFGGFCAWAVSQGYTASIDPNAFQIVDGRLILQYSPGVRNDFNKDTAGNLSKADANWPGIVKKKGK